MELVQRKMHILDVDTGISSEKDAYIRCLQLQINICFPELGLHFVWWRQFPTICDSQEF